jgi:hypothetical protein
MWRSVTDTVRAGRPISTWRSGGSEVTTNVWGRSRVAQNEFAVCVCAATRLAIQKYFAHGYIPSPHSIYEGTHMLSVGSNLTFDLGHPRARIERYRQFELQPEKEGGP